MTPDLLTAAPPCSSSEESEKNLRNLSEEEARACAILIK